MSTSEGDKESEMTTLVDHDVEAPVTKDSLKNATEQEETEEEKRQRILHKKITSVSYEAAVRAEEEASSNRGWMFFAICMLQMLANFDSGILPATLGQVQASFDPPISDVDAGSLGRYIALDFLNFFMNLH